MQHCTALLCIGPVVKFVLVVLVMCAQLASGHCLVKIWPVENLLSHLKLWMNGTEVTFRIESLSSVPYISFLCKCPFIHTYLFDNLSLSSIDVESCCSISTLPASTIPSRSS